MRILHLIESGGFYGAERVLIELVIGLRELQCDSFVLSVGVLGDNKKDIEEVMNRYHINYIPLRIKTRNSLQIIDHINALTEKHGCEVIHSHGYKFNILLGLFRHKLNEVVSCTTVHGYVTPPTISKMAIYQWLDKRVLKKLDHVFLVTKALSHITPLNQLPENRLTVIENGIGGYKSSTEKIEPYVVNMLEAADFRIMSVGRLAKEKGYEYLIEAVSKLKKEGYRVILIIFGDGPDRGSLQKRIEDYGISENVFLYGFSSSVVEFFPYFDCFVMPSLTEATPVALIEAMRAKVPCVATCVGEIPIMLEQGDAGWLNRPMQVNELVENMQSVILANTQPKIERAYKKAITDYSYKTMASAYLQQYQALIGK